MKIQEIDILAFRIAIVTVSVLFLLNLSACQTEKNNSNTAQRYNQKNLELSNYLCSKYETNLLADSATFFTPDYQKNLLASPVILDSLIHSLTSEDGQYFLTAEIKSDSNTRIFARLEITEELFNSFSIAESSRVFLAVQVNSVKTEKGFLESSSFFATENFSINTNDILLEGICMEIIPQESMLAIDTLG